MNKPTKKIREAQCTASPTQPRWRSLSVPDRHRNGCEFTPFPSGNVGTNSCGFARTSVSVGGVA